MHNGYYAGIGARRTPSEFLTLMERCGTTLASDGWTLRSGNADGADQAFGRGTNVIDPSMVQLYLPYRGFKAEAIVDGNQVMSPDDIPQWAFTDAEKWHPAWHRCSPFARTAHARNSMIILGPDGEYPVTFVICWTPGGDITGGTGQAIRCAMGNNIDVYNLAIPRVREAITTRLHELEKEE